MPTAETTRDPSGAPAVQATDPREEYVSAGFFPFIYSLYGSGNRALSWSFDDLTWAFGPEVYDRMMWDSQVAANLHVLKAGILSQDPSVSNAVADDHPKAETGDQVAQFFKRTLARLKGLRTHTLYNMLDCLMLGNKIAERVYEPAADEGGKLVIKRLAVKPRTALLFETDAYLNVLGFRVSVTGRLPGNDQNAAEIIPPNKCSVMAHAIRDEDPRGTSLGRSIYEPWFGKMQVWPEFLKYLAQFSSSSVWGTTPQGAVPVPQTDPATGQPLTNPDGSPVMANPAIMMRDGAQTIRNGGVAIFPFGSLLNVVPPQGEGAPFLNAFRWFDEQMTIAMLGQSLATMEGEHQSRAASQVHQDALQTRIQMGKTLVEETLWALADDLRMRNFPNSDGLTPKISLGDVGPQDQAPLMMAIAALEKAGYIAPSQRASIDAIISLPIRQPEETAAETERFLNPPTPPAGPQDNQNNQDGEGDGSDNDLTAAFGRWQAERLAA